MAIVYPGGEKWKRIGEAYYALLAAGWAVTIQPIGVGSCPVYAVLAMKGKLLLSGVAIEQSDAWEKLLEHTEIQLAIKIARN